MQEPPELQDVHALDLPLAQQRPPWQSLLAQCPPLLQVPPEPFLVTQLPLET